ncbi:MAG: 6-O-methylguanine DNA methyltransferase [Parcubacteria group bacterium CG08_land_8_20_14_0_20_48_21]|nr:MAG: hypothetical protein AUK21_01530 [Parcubacteria group bacterium CG2_30_48_51]PIS32890.1 MAG: 6-O-methylguanine DNA methyltransferase [Parcubacteria group bacterium CG08_land_8_20_14_0_20_48_21]PIW78772.1 MAG: 6-O-methylguanine DNA methyltransferase [Parcubacteria group bacterium CG_4_8_14_3_um_filter_48_16]PIY78259.1 MAG: 6-O-methylguanine DNA methyltransferase [Parcubacteria group bacterium CG_4_10_14_0_8_um_filter_48_154]PIZ77610.1 MAG: 6-O-methylguanine DNA methyltransferase [bacteri
MDFSFRERVYKIVAAIPQGQVRTYKQVAQLAGNERAYRAVGSILHKNTNPNVPCHRVIRSDGTIGGYNKGAKEKVKILQQEGYVP